MTPVLVNRCRKTNLQRAFLLDLVPDIGRILKRRRLLKKKTRELILVFVDPKEMRSLNRKYRKRDYPTDVLSFEAADESSLGELVFCPQVLREQAKDTGLTFRLELTYMIIHGCLHLLGYDHETSKTDEKKMMKLQEAIFNDLISLAF